MKAFHVMQYLAFIAPLNALRYDEWSTLYYTPNDINEHSLGKRGRSSGWPTRDDDAYKDLHKGNLNGTDCRID